MIEDVDLLNMLAGIGQSFSFLLLLLGVYLWTLKPILTDRGTDDEDSESH